MSVELSHAALLKQWFTPAAEGEPGVDVADRLSMKMDLERVRDLLAELWFSADYAWVGWSEADILTVLQQWLPPESPDEPPFLQCAIQGKLAEFLTWIESAMLRWEAEEAEATADSGLENPEYERDPIEGTRFYRWANGEYLYSDDQYEPYQHEGPAWLNLDDRIAAQDLTRPHYDPDTDRWRRSAADGEHEYQDRADGFWERSDGESWLRMHSEAAGWLPYDKGSRTWFYGDDWRSYDEVAALLAAPPQVQSLVIPVHQILGWGSLEGQPWADDWYALPGPDAYTYLHSPSTVPTQETPGWSDIPPAPPLEPTDESARLTDEQMDEAVLLGFTLDEAADAIEALTAAIAEAVGALEPAEQ